MPAELVPSDTVGEKQSGAPLQAAGGSLATSSFLGLGKHHPNSHLQLRRSPVPMSRSPLYKDASHVGLGAQPTPLWPHLNQLHL